MFKKLNIESLFSPVFRISPYIVVNVLQIIVIFAFVRILLKVTYSAYKRMFTMIYGEILKTGEKWRSMLSFVKFHGFFNADSKLPKVMWIPQGPLISNKFILTLKSN